jgi:hypothetical protein
MVRKKASDLSAGQVAALHQLIENTSFPPTVQIPAEYYPADPEAERARWLERTARWRQRLTDAGFRDLWQPPA